MDKEIKDAIEVLLKIMPQLSRLSGTLPISIDEYDTGVNKAIGVLQQYLSIKGMPVEKRENYQDRPYQLGYQDGSNDTLKDCKLAVMKMFSVERIVEVIKDGKYYKGNIYEQLQHYSNGDCDEKNLIKDIAQAIHNLINEEEK